MRDHEQLLGVERDIERLSPPFIEDTRPRPPLRLVVDPSPVLRRAPSKGRRRDSVAVGVAAVVLLLAAAVGVSIAMGWIR